ncbi:hypothetical protein B0H19DRAFT_1237789 [Mycena capillaripes]|nr:hypothetical protein B0H19DRAFT_1237789 [Mycena capillaripes]
MSTMLYDAHMSDSFDVDMHHPESSHPEPWFDAEAKMDDVPPENHFTDHESSLSVEVDMDDHYAQNEYEMGDGEGEENYEEMSSDLLDIEVYDASEPLEDATLPPAEPANPPDSEPFDIDSPATAKPLLLSVAVTPAMSPLPPLDTDLPDAVASEHVEAAVEEHVDEENTGAQPPLELVIPLPDDGNVETTDQFQHHESVDGPEQAETATLDVPQPNEPHPSFSGDEQEQAETVTDVPPPEEHHSSSDTTAPHSHDVEEPVAGDPHEISEGVYIDPPPAVLVSFEFSDCPDICLFNQPARSRSPSPSTEGREQAYQVFDLLLHYRPILYYEPLASVFEALRQEEYLTRIPHLADSELVLDAYDLQLVISEDNVYAREVTLHDLNVLHDGSDITGPLRLRLSSVIPRFILRYHLLQDQVSRLNLAAAGDEQEPSTTEQSQERQQEGAQEDDAATLQANEIKNAAASYPDPHHADEDQRNTAQEDPEETAPEAETVREENAETDEYADSHGADDGEGYGEKLQPDQVGDAETGDLPDPPEEEEEEAEETEAAEEEFVVVETSGPESIIPLTGTATAEGTGNELEKKLDPPLLSDTGHRNESGPSNSETPNHEDESETNVNTEGATGVLADNSVDPSANDTYDEGESYGEEDAQWEDAVDGEEDPDTTWEAEAEQETASNESSVTLSSKASKRSFDEIEFEEDEVVGQSPPGSPGAKRTRVD